MDFKKKGMFSKIESREDALKVVKDTSIAFYWIAGITAVLTFLVGLGTLIDAVLFAVLAFLLRWFTSRVAAVVLVVLAGGGLIMTGFNRFGGGEGGNNIIVALILFWASIRAVEATFKLHGEFSAVDLEDPHSERQQPLKYPQYRAVDLQEPQSKKSVEEETATTPNTQSN